MYFPFLRYESFLAVLESAPGIAAWLLINLATSMILLPYFYFRSLEY